MATMQQELAQSAPRVAKTLSPPIVLKDTLAQLLEILKEHRSSVMGAHAATEQDPTLAAVRESLSEAHILDSMRSSLLKMCLLAAEPLGPLDTAIFMANCVNMMQVA